MQKTCLRQNRYFFSVLCLFSGGILLKLNFKSKQKFLMELPFVSPDQFHSQDTFLLQVLFRCIQPRQSIQRLYFLTNSYPTWKSDPVYLPVNTKIQYKQTQYYELNRIDIFNIVVECSNRGKFHAKALILFSYLRQVINRSNHCCSARALS